MKLKGKEYATSNSFGKVDYCWQFSKECYFNFADDELGYPIRAVPPNSRYIKSEDILYEIKKIQQRQILSEGMTYDYVKNGMSVEEAEEINTMARYLNCQFIIATHSPFLLGTLEAKIYNIDSPDYDVAKWTELENVRYFYDFFKKHEKDFINK